jgi:hypothetical protein
MKRLVVLILGMLALFACETDPVPTEDSTWDIETAAMYEQLGIIDEVRTGLTSGDYLLVDSLLVYDGQGHLIARQGVQFDALGRVSMTIQDLTDGTYTFVLFQACSQAGKPSIWTAIDAGQLATLQIRCPDVCVEGIQALGVAKENVTIRKGAMSTALTPRAAGSIVDFQVDNYASEKIMGMSRKLPSIWIYGNDSIAGFNPDSGRYRTLPGQKKAIGSLEDGQAHRKFFLLTDGSEMTASVQSDYDFVYFEDTICLSPGSSAVCYYSFAPKTFFYACLGTPETVEAFKAGHAEEDCTLYPCLQWGASRDEVDRYVKNRPFLPAGEGDFLERPDGITRVRYEPAPGLAELCFFDPAGKLIEVTYSHGGPASLASVQSCMEKQDFKYMGSFVQEVFVYRLYLSADEQTEFVAYSTNDVIYAEGFGEWAATFQPFNPDHLDLLEL